MKPKPIVIYGKPYRSTDEMPEDIQRRYEQALLALVIFLCLVGAAGGWYFSCARPE